MAQYSEYRHSHNLQCLRTRSLVHLVVLVCVLPSNECHPFQMRLHSCIQLGFVCALSAEPSNTVFAIVRNEKSATQLHNYVNNHLHKNVHILEADITDIDGLKVYCYSDTL